MRAGAVLSLLLTLATSFSLCGLTIDSQSDLHSVSLLDFDSGSLSSWLDLPALSPDGAGSASAGADFGSYYTVTTTVEKESDFFLVDLKANTSKFVKMVMPPPYTNLTRYGIASLNIDPQSKRALALIVGIDGLSWFCFLGLLNDKTGGIDQVIVDLSEDMRTWTYLYDGITAWDPKTGMYYLVAVIGEHDTTTILAFNTTKAGTQKPVYKLPFPYDEEGVGMYQSLAISPHLEAQHKGSLVALVDDIGNTAAAVWATAGPTEDSQPSAEAVPFRTRPFQRVPKGHRHKVSPRNANPSNKPRDPPAPWNVVIQFEPRTLSMSGENNMILDDQGNAFALFYDHHTPVANQIVVQIDLVKGKELGRVSVDGSQMGNEIDFLMRCPPA